MLRRRYGLDRCRDHREDGLGGWVGWGIVTANPAKTTASVAAQTS